MIGYLSELDCRPGDKLDVMVSSDAAEVSIDLVRLINGDDRPEAPGLRYQIIENVPQQIINLSCIKRLSALMDIVQLMSRLRIP